MARLSEKEQNVIIKIFNDEKSGMLTRGLVKIYDDKTMYIDHFSLARGRMRICNDSTTGTDHFSPALGRMQICNNSTTDTDHFSLARGQVQTHKPSSALAQAKNDMYP